MVAQDPWLLTSTVLTTATGAGVLVGSIIAVGSGAGWVAVAAGGWGYLSLPGEQPWGHCRRRRSREAPTGL